MLSNISFESCDQIDQIVDLVSPMTCDLLVPKVAASTCSGDALVVLLGHESTNVIAAVLSVFNDGHFAQLPFERQLQFISGLVGFETSPTLSEAASGLLGSLHVVILILAHSALS